MTDTILKPLTKDNVWIDYTSSNYIMIGVRVDVVSDQIAEQIKDKIIDNDTLRNIIDKKLKDEQNHTLHSIEGQGCRYCSEVTYLERLLANVNAQRSRSYE